MANFIITQEKELRPCLYTLNGTHNNKGLFHCWSQETRIIPPSALRGGHGGGPIQITVAIIETEKGNVVTISPSDFKFIDGKIKQYAFGEDENNA